ncbi:protein SCAR2 isoform X2 [Prunus dulcis]|uniref:protein SCAR2 isoform X2 n=1 Tax=Prunus dulcis TaxID=3755 RepID=UPI001482268D|nr:protein SCAR2 isoform X2 [Prunus dulcis]
MPLTRYQIRNEYGLADPELYGAADRDDPEALLEGVAMAGLVGVLRQLGDLAEFAAEIFHDLHEEVMATATRGHGLVVRVQQLEADFPSIEKAFLSQTNHSSFFSNSGVDWHPNLRSEQNMITRGDLPRFVMDSYEECRGPPRLFLLDKFDVAGDGACLKRYTDPSFFKVEPASSIATVEMQREKKIRKVKKKGSRWRNGETPEAALTSHAKLHELFLEERIENGHSDPARLVKLKKRHLNGSAVDSKTGKSYMEKFLETPSPERKLVCETSVTPPLLRLTSDNTGEPELRILDISIVSPAAMSPETKSTNSSPNSQEAILELSVDGFNGEAYDEEVAKGSEPNSDVETNKSYSNLQKVAVDKRLAGDGEHKTGGSVEGSTPSSSDDMTSEVDNYMDALATMDSEMETDNEYKLKNNVRFLNVEKYGTDSDANEEEHLDLPTRFPDSQSIGNSSASDDGKNSFEKDRASISHSDTLSNLVESTPSECNGSAKEFPSTETCGADNFEMSSDQNSEIAESLEATSKEHVVSQNACIKEEVIPDSGDTSCSAFVRETSPTLQHSDPGANSQVVSLAGLVLDETPSNEINVGYKSLDINENGTHLDDSLAVVPNDSSQNKDEFTNTSSSHPVDESDDEDLGVSSDALLHLSDVEELSSEDQIGNNAVNEMSQTQCANEDSIESFARRKSDSPFLSISPTEEQVSSSALPEVQTPSGNMVRPYYRDIINPDNMASKLDDPVTPTAVNSEVIPFVVDAAWSTEELCPVVDAPQTHGLMEQQDAPQTHGIIEQQDAQQTHVLIEQQDAPQTHVLIEQQDAPQTHGLIEQQDAPQTHVLKEQQDAPQTHGLLEQQISDLSEDVPQLESISAEAVAPHYKQKIDVEETSRTMDGEELRLVTSGADVEGGDTVSVELPSNCLTYPGHEDHAKSDDVVPETLHVETVAVPYTAVAQPDDYVNDVSHSSPNAISSPPRNFINLNESLPGFGDSHEKETELDEVVFPEFVTYSEVQKEGSKKEVVSLDSESNSSKSVAYDLSSSTNGGHLDELTENSLAVCDGTAESNPSKSTTYDHSSSKISDNGHNFSPNQQSENSLAVHDVTTASTSLEMSHPESESQSLDQSDKEDVVSSPTCHLPEPETSSEKSLELQANQVDMEYLPRDGADRPEAALEQSLVFQSDQLDVECLQEDRASINSSSLQSAQIGAPNHMDEERSKELPSTENVNQDIRSDASSESCPRDLPSQPLTSVVLPESAGQEVDVTKQTMEPLESTLPRLVPEATAVNLEDMPPLPPLPPMQWRIGKQHPSLPSFLPIQPSEADEKAQFDIPAPQREVLQPQNPFLPLTYVEDGKSQHVSEPLMGNVVHPAPYSLHLPAIVNDANYQYSFPDLGGTQFPNPFLSSSEISDDRSGHNHFALEGEKVQSSTNPFTVPHTECTTFRHEPESSDGAIILPLQQLTLETDLESKVLEHSLKNSEWEHGKPPPTSVTAPTMVDEQPQHSLTTSEGETTWSPNNSAAMSDYEVGRSNGIPVSKLPRPRNPLIDAVAAHGQSKLRKVTERIRPQVEPKVDERDSLLQQIRTKSFNLKPASVTRQTVTRPSIQGPTTNLRVAAILEKANAIRQALTGSDEDDEDSWSDS